MVTAIVLAFAGVSPATAGADQPEDHPVQQCLSALQGDPDVDLALSTDPEDGPVAPGDEIEVTLTWDEDVWETISKIYICMEVDGEIDEDSIFEEKPGVDDGTASATFTVPEGAEEVCFNGRISGDPAEGNSSDDTHKTAQTCFEVGEDTPDDVCEELEGVQTDPADCDTPDDVCEELEGVQTDPADCDEDVLPSNETPTDPADPVVPGTEVKGAVTLPVTGTSTGPLAALALGLIAVGRVLVTRSRKTIG
jgi:hypothetical protein